MAGIRTRTPSPVSVDSPPSFPVPTPGPLSWAAPPTGWGRGLPCDEGSKEAEHGQQDLVADTGQDVHEGGVGEVHNDLLGQSHRCQQPSLLTAVQSTGA